MLSYGSIYKISKRLYDAIGINPVEAANIIPYLIEEHCAA
jgi:hypothetical protein